MAVISLIHPSRGRPEKAKATYDYWMSQAAQPDQIEHILSLDFSDRRNEDYGVGLDGMYSAFGPNSRIIIDHNECVVEATNQAAKVAKGDVLIYLSDDFSAPHHWDTLILDRLDTTKPQLLRVNDGYQPMENNVLTIPIMTRPLCTHLGYFFYPEYKSMWCDVDLFYICQPYMITVPDLIFKHYHPVVTGEPYDETYQRSNAHFQTGQQIFNRRSAEFGWGNAFNKMP